MQQQGTSLVGVFSFLGANRIQEVIFVSQIWCLIVIQSIDCSPWPGFDGGCGSGGGGGVYPLPYFQASLGKALHLLHCTRRFHIRSLLGVVRSHLKPTPGFSHQEKLQQGSVCRSRDTTGSMPFSYRHVFAGPLLDLLGHSRQTSLHIVY